MTFTVSLPAAAHRHLDAAEVLSETHRRDVAGYLYGLAAECAVKAMLIDTGWPPELNNRRNDNPLYAHFPELRTLLRDTLRGRKAAPLLALINNDAFMNHWSITMRYSDGREIDDRWITSWARDARQVISCIGT